MDNETCIYSAATGTPCGRQAPHGTVLGGRILPLRDEHLALVDPTHSCGRFPQPATGKESRDEAVANYRAHMPRAWIAPTPATDAIQVSYKDASEGHDTWDVVAAALYHFLACYAMTHTKAQHIRMIRLIRDQIARDDFEK